MKSIKELFKGYLACIKEIFFMKNEKEYFTLNLNIYSILLILGLQGLLRDFLEVCLEVRIHPKWYVMDRDIVFTMFFFAIYLCFFGAFITHIISKLFKENIPYPKLFAFTFYLQAVHLIIPPLDYIGLKYDIPWYFYLSRPFIGEYFTNALVMTLGIICAWFITITVLIKIFIDYFNVKILKTLIILLISFNFLYWPVYHVWPTFNTLFNLIFSCPNTHKGLYWGYGLFFMFSSFIGIIYYKKNIK